MGVYGGPSIIMGGLVMFLDAANSRSYISGSISMIFLYNRNITQSESKQNYNSYKARFNL